MTALQLVLADAQTKSANGAEGLVVFLFLAVAVYFLLRSMTKHLRKAQLMKMNDAADAVARANLPEEPRPPVAP